MSSKVWHCKNAMEKPSLEEAQKFVDGHVELLRCGELQLLINEEGMYRPDLSVNETATQMAINANYAVPRHGIVGNVIILEGSACWE